MGSSKSFQQAVPNLCIILCAGIIAYLNAANGGFLVLDDNGMLASLQSTSYSLVQIFLGGGGEYYRPLTVISFLFDRHWFGNDPQGYHLVNVALHLANGFLIYYLARELFREEEGRDFAALCASLLFVLSPLNSEAVLWVSARTDLFCTLFALLALIVVVKRGGEPRMVDGALVFVALLCSLMVKEASVALLAVIPLYLAWLGRAGAARRLVLAVPAIAAVLLYLFLRSDRQVKADAGVAKVVATVADASSARTSIVGDAVAAYGFYLKKLLMPFPLDFAITDINRTLAICCFLVLIPLAGVLFVRWRHSRLPLLLICCGIALPVLAFLGKIPWTPYAERYLYLPMVGFALLVGCATFRVRVVPRVLIVAFLLVLAIPTINRAALWADPIAFWGDIVEKNPRFARAHGALAAEYLAHGQYQQAEQSSRNALELGLDRDFVWVNLAESHYARREYDRYEHAMIRAAEVSSHPASLYIDLIARLGKIQGRGDDRPAYYHKAIGYYLKAYEYDETYVDGLYNAGKLYWALGENGQATAHLQQFLNHPRNHENKKYARIILDKISVSGRI
ncbi:hypothetical protein ANAEL_05346 [Anaerolineales bacterium]|nr:hypothetical protein ANAEL_05346 [Anaerolineales bacterium]